MDLGTWAAVQVGLAQHQPYLVGSTDKTRAAVAAVLGPTPEGLQLLFIERAQHPDDPWSGHIAFPGGRIEADDPSPRAAAERETLEEVGLDLSNAEYWGRVDDLTGHMLPVVVSGFVYCLETPAALTLNHEIESAFWAGADQLRDPDQADPVPSATSRRRADISRARPVGAEPPAAVGPNLSHRAPISRLDGARQNPS